MKPVSFPNTRCTLHLLLYTSFFNTTQFSNTSCFNVPSLCQTQYCHLSQHVAFSCIALHAASSFDQNFASNNLSPYSPCPIAFQLTFPCLPPTMELNFKQCVCTSVVWGKERKGVCGGVRSCGGTSWCVGCVRQAGAAGGTHCHSRSPSPRLPSPTMTCTSLSHRCHVCREETQGFSTTSDNFLVNIEF